MPAMIPGLPTELQTVPPAPVLGVAGSSDVFSVSHLFEVVRVYASPVLAQVVNFKPACQESLMLLKHPAVCERRYLLAVSSELDGAVTE